MSQIAPTEITEISEGGLEILALYGLSVKDLEATTELVSIETRCAWCEPGLASGVSHVLCDNCAMAIRNS